LVYPSIRQLPLLGVRYMQLYREAKVQETVFQILTQQYEMAKIEEAKQIPSVRVLDSAEKPEKKSSPVRWLVIVAGLVFSLIFGVVWIMGQAAWQEVDTQHPYKLFLGEVARTASVSASPFYSRMRRAAGLLTGEREEDRSDRIR